MRDARLTQTSQDLAERLERGWWMIIRKREEGASQEEIEKLEDHWMRLLREYEELYDFEHS